MQSLSFRDRVLKRVLDLAVALPGLVVTAPLLIALYLIASLDTKASGFFTQSRVGRNGRLFRVVKIRTMRVDVAIRTSVTTDQDPRITRFGRFLRKTKLDEIPQLLNVLAGQMSLVGPRPDVPEYMGNLQGEDRIVLAVRPGITGPASLKFRDEERLLAEQDEPERYYREVVFPEKLRINREYVRRYSLVRDLGYLWRTVFG